MSKTTTQSTTQRYLTDELSEQELVNFKGKLEANEDFEEEVAEEVVQSYGRIRLNEKLDKIYAEETSQTKVKRLPGFNRYLSIAAAILVFLVSIGYWILKPNGENESILASNLKPYRTLSVHRGEASFDESWENGMNQYKQANYGDAITYLLAASLASPEHKYLADFYIGICYLAKVKPQPPQAIIYLLESQIVDSDIKQQATWFLALAYFENKEKAKAKSLLEKIAGPQNAYQQEAAASILKDYFEQ
jgi:hypothetical protein